MSVPKAHENSKVTSFCIVVSKLFEYECILADIQNAALLTTRFVRTSKFCSKHVNTLKKWNYLNSFEISQSSMDLFYCYAFEKNRFLMTAVLKMIFRFGTNHVEHDEYVWSSQA